MQPKRSDIPTKHRKWEMCLTYFAVSCTMAFGVAGPCLGQAKGEIVIDLVEAKTDLKLLSRVKLVGPNGSALKPRSLEQVQGWSLVDGKLAFRGKPGDYRYEIFHGPEFAPARGHFTLDKNSEAIDSIELPRHADLASEGWFGGDLLSYQPRQSAERWLHAESLLLSSSVAVMPFQDRPREKTGSDAANDKGDLASRFTALLDDRPESGLLFHHWSPSEPYSGDTPSSRLIVLAKQTSAEEGQVPVHVEIQNICARDLPIWLASGRVDSVQLLSQHLTIDGSRASKILPLVVPDGNFRGERGPGRIVEQVYFKMLDAGLRIPPTAGSGFGKSPSPLGYNRVYALTGSQNEAVWWEAIRQGNSFVSNGPLLRVAINGRPPGHVFQFSSNVELDIGVALTTSDPIEYLEVIFNGSNIYKAALDEHAKKGGKIPPLEIKQSGWLIVRTVTARDFTYRMASTAPFYFELNGQNRIDPQAVEFFRSWLAKTRSEIAKLSSDIQQLHEPYLKSAERFWATRTD